jgi:hypothetical protein
MRATLFLRLGLVLMCSAVLGCPGSDSGDDDTASGDGGTAGAATARDGGGDDGDTHADRDGGGAKPAKDAGSMSARTDAGDRGGAAGSDDADGHATADTCKPAKGAVPTWTEVDPKLPDFEVTGISAAMTPPPSGFSGVAFGNGVFVAPGASSDEDHMRWATSADGVKWTPHSQPIETGTTYSTSAIHFVKGKFLFFAEHAGDGFHAYTSDDGTSWTNAKITDERFIVDEFAASGDAVIVLGESGKALRSTDLETWTPLEIVPGGGLFSYNDIAFGGGRWVAATNNGGQVYGSADGAKWDLLGELTTPGGFHVEFGNGAWVANAPGVYFIGSDGEEFSAFMPEGNHYGAIRFAGGRFIDYGTDLQNNLAYSVSDDGKSWSEFGTLPPEKVGDDEQYRARLIRDTAYGNCRYVSVGWLTVLTKPKGTDPFSGEQSVLPLLLVGELKTE